MNYILYSTGDVIMMSNIARVAKGKSRELRPRRKGLRTFGARGMGLRKSSVSAYEV